MLLKITSSEDGEEYYGSFIYVFKPSDNFKIFNTIEQLKTLKFETYLNNSEKQILILLYHFDLFELEFVSLTACKIATLSLHQGCPIFYHRGPDTEKTYEGLQKLRSIASSQVH